MADRYPKSAIKTPLRILTAVIHGLTRLAVTGPLLLGACNARLRAHHILDQ